MLIDCFRLLAAVFLLGLSEVVFCFGISIVLCLIIRLLVLHHMADLISRNWIIHFEDVLEEIEHEKADWEEGKYEEAGIHLATIL